MATMDTLVALGTGAAWLYSTTVMIAIWSGKSGYSTPRFFKAFGDPTRLNILCALETGEMCVCDIAATLRITESAVSHQLRHLRQLNLVANRREGTVLYYRLNDEHIEDVLQLALEHVRE